MAKGTVNKVIIIGRLGQDPEVRYMPSGGAVANLSVATNEAWKNKNTGEPEGSTEWHRCVCFNRTAEIAGEYLKKGSMVYLEGRLQTRKWQDKNGMDRYTTEIRVTEMQFLGGRNDNQGSGFSEGNDNAQAFSGASNNNSAPQSTTPQATSANKKPETANSAPSFDQDFDDEIPF